ncbi:hypothetical protein EG328_007653 [Venturia inaequalis]|uniref:Uncharacterized protein n=1 Tax=Venturia inaequalis TaxID=5025 RepID=A0A8H3UES4_VENIN|nr:hypothetical protein EG328_007653 [Venturia inaequalis]
MKLVHLLYGAMSITACLAQADIEAETEQIVKNKAMEIISDLEAGRSNPAQSLPPYLTDEEQKGFMEMVQAFGLEQLAFDRFGQEIIHGPQPAMTDEEVEDEDAARIQDEAQKKWEKSVDNWAGYAAKAFDHRKLQRKTLLELNNGTQKILNAMYDIDHSTLLPVGLDERKAVGILVHENIESLRMQASPYKPRQAFDTRNSTLESLRSRQQHVVAVIRGIFEEIPQSRELLNDDMIEIIGRNEKEHGNDYFMKHYVTNKPDQAEKREGERLVERITSLYQDQQKEPEALRERRHAELIDALLAALSAPDEPSSPSVTVQLAKRSTTTTLPPKSPHIQIITITAPTPMSTTTLTVDPTPSVASFSFNTRAPTNGTGENTSTIIVTVADISTVTVTAKSSSSTESVGTITPTPMTTSTPSNSTHPFEPMTIIPVPPSAGQVERPEHSPEQSKDEEKKKKKKKKSKELGLAIGLPLSGAAASVAAAAWVATKTGPKMLRVSSNMARAGTEMIHRTNQLVKGVKTGIEKSLKLTEKFGRAAEAAMNEFAIDGSVDIMIYIGQTASRDAGLEMGDSAANFVSKANEVSSGIGTWIKNWIINILRGKGIGHRLREGRLKENDLKRLKEYEKYPSVQEHPTTEPHQPGTVEDWLWYKIKESIFQASPQVTGNGYYKPDPPPMGIRRPAYELAQTYETKLAERIEEIDRFHFDDTVRNDHWDRDREENYDSQDDEEYSYPEDDSQAPNDPEKYGNEAVEWEIPFAEWMRDPERNQKPWKDRLRDYKRQFGDPGPNALRPTPPNAPNGPSSINAPSGQESRPQPTEPPHTTDATQFNAPVGSNTKTGGSEVLYLGHYATPDDSGAENTDDS